MSGEGTAPSKHSRKPQKDDMSGKPAGGQTARATATDKQFKPAGKSPGKKKNPKPQKRPVHNSTRDKGY
jgi:hypothetical protein